jgi:hypothetical protein
MVLPRTDIEIQTARLQLLSVAMVPGFAEQIREVPLPAVHVGKWQLNVTLTAMRRVIHRNDEVLAPRPTPRAGDEAVG